MAKQAKCGGSGFTRLDNSDEPGCSYCREAFSPSTRFGCKVPRSDRFSTSECCCDVPAEECEEACRKADQLPLVGELVSAGSSKKTAAEEHHSAIWTGISWWPNKWNPFREATVGTSWRKGMLELRQCLQSQVSASQSLPFLQCWRLRSISPTWQCWFEASFRRTWEIFFELQMQRLHSKLPDLFHSHGTAWDLFDIHHWQCVRQWDR